jgi:hypothetical protein
LSKSAHPTHFHSIGTRFSIARAVGEAGYCSAKDRWQSILSRFSATLTMARELQ